MLFLIVMWSVGIWWLVPRWCDTSYSHRFSPAQWEAWSVFWALVILTAAIKLW